MSDYALHAVLSFLSVAVCLALALLMIARAQRLAVHWAFAASLMALAIVQIGNGLNLLADSAHEVLQWRRLAMVGEILMPTGWLVFSLTFARSNARDILHDWEGGVWASGLLTVLFLGLVPSDRMFSLASAPDAPTHYVVLGPTGRIYASLYLIAQVLILSNLEQTLRYADEEARWYVKFPVVGLGLLCVYFIYQTSDLLLYSVWHPELAWLSGAVSVAACGLIAYGLFRRPIPNAQIYISSKVVSGSLTFLIVGGLLVGTGLVAWFIRESGLSGGVVLSTLFVMLAVTGLVFLLLSAHLRQILGRFVERHFFPHKYDYRARWLEVTEAVGAPGTPEQIAWRVTQLCKGIFGARTISVWMAAGLDEGEWTRIGAYNVGGTSSHMKGAAAVKAWLEAQSGPRDFLSEDPTFPPVLAADLGATEAVLIVPLKAGHQAIGWIALGPHAGGGGYTHQDRDLLRCIAAQVADRLQHLALADKLAMSREMEAFYEYSTFFLHDLKNFTATLSLVVQNAERRGGDPEFQQAAMRTVGATVRKMTALMGTVAALSRDPCPKLTEVDLTVLADEVLKRFNGAAGAILVRQFQPVPMVEADPDQLQQVLLNLILNAQEAVGPEGRITVRTEARGHEAWLVVEDNGCGMDSATMSQLFRPFRTTKGRGLGIGLYQCRKIMEAHRGVLEVESELGKGTRFLMRLQACAKRGKTYG